MSDSPALDAIAATAKAMDRAAGKGDRWRKTDWGRYRAGIDRIFKRKKLLTNKKQCNEKTAT